MREKDEAREERILMEVVVDAYCPAERAMGWYYYLEEEITFPFIATCINVDKSTPLELGEQVTVIEMSGEDCCEHDMYVDVSWKDKTLAIPLAQIKPLNADEESKEAVGDWHYWKEQGYSF